MNTLKIAKKEFLDLFFSRQLICVFILYFIIVVGTVLTFNNMYASGPVVDLGNVVLTHLMIILSYYGSLFAIVIAMCSFTKEQIYHSLNILITKPVYRENVINGKLIGVSAYILSVFLIITSVYIWLNWMLLGVLMEKVLPAVLGNLPIIFVFSLLCMIVFMSMTILFYQLFNARSTALMVSFVAWIVLMYLLPNMLVSGYLSEYIGSYFNIDSSSVGYFLSSLSPTTMIGIPVNFTYLVKISIYAVISLILSYIAFLKRDII